MMKAEPLPPDASIASTGLGIRYIGSGKYQHAYAYSGDVAPGGTSGTALDFTTGSGYIRGSFYYTADASAAGGQYIVLQINFNGVTVLYSKEKRDESLNDTPWPLIIPPFTHVIATYEVPSTSVPTTLIFTGRVYGAPE